MVDETEDPTGIEGVPHPRQTRQVFGHEQAEKELLEAFNTGRLHHAWLMTGPRGIGKATLAWRMARFLRATPSPMAGTAEEQLFAPEHPQTLDIPEDHPVARQIIAQSEPGVICVQRSANEKTGRLRDQIVIDDIRAVAPFLHLAASDGGTRVVIIDAADEMNVNAANALLKMLEEPPAKTTFFLIAHQPGRLLPTIRSRCRSLGLKTPSAQAFDLALAQAGVDPSAASDALRLLSGGSIGAAMRLISQDGLALYAEILSIMEGLPQFNRAAAVHLADRLAARGAQSQLDLFYELIEIALSRLARHAALGAQDEAVTDKEGAIFSRLARTPKEARIWAQDASAVLARARHGRAVNLDPGALVLDTITKLSITAGKG